MTDRNKTRVIDYDTISGYDNAEKLLYELTRFEAVVLLSQCEYIGWKTRWHNLPSQFDIDAVRGEVTNALMNPVDCEEKMLRWNNCVLEESDDGVIWTPVTGYDENCFVSDSELSSAVDGLQSQIDSNDGDIASLQSQVSQNLISIGNNADDITALNNQVGINTAQIASNITQISDNASDIATNIASINNLQSQVSQNIADIDNHETRITSLENSSGGGGTAGSIVEISREILDVNGTFAPVDVSQYSYWRATMLVAHTSGSSNYLSAQLTPQNTVDSTLLANSALVALVASETTANAGMFTQISIECEGSNLDDRAKSLSIIYNNPTGAGLNPNFSGHNMQSWDIGAIQSVNFALNSGNMLAGSMLRIVGILEDTPQPVTETLFFDFANGDLSDVIQIDEGSWNAGYLAVVDGLPAENIDFRVLDSLMSGLNVTQFEMRIEHTVSSDYTVTDGTSSQTVSVSPGITNYVQNCDFDDGFRAYQIPVPANNSTRVYHFRIIVTGIIPTELQPYIEV